MIWFQLWREFKLSIAEIYNVFDIKNILYFDKNILITNDIELNYLIKKAETLWWCIKIFKLKKYLNSNINEVIKDWLELSSRSWKFNYAINTFWEEKSLKEILKISKKIIKESSLNPRFINKDFKNISSILIIKEALVKKETDFNIVFDKDIIYFWNTIWVQDIYSYSNRDYGKDRDMNIGMLPPKLAQIMINLWRNKNKEIKNIYDPFVWLWTVLIEAVYSWIKDIYGSDINNKMVETSKNNLKKLKSKFNFNSNIFLQNSKYINEVDIISNIDLIVTEWYLWEIMTKNNISIDRINKQKLKLISIYSGFFEWLKKKNFKWTLVISFPFWEIKWKYFYFEEIYEIIKKYCKIKELLPKNIWIKETKSWSLLYKRSSQLVWREIFVLKIK